MNAREKLEGGQGVARVNGCSNTSSRFSIARDARLGLRLNPPMCRSFHDILGRCEMQRPSCSVAQGISRRPAPNATAREQRQFIKCNTKKHSDSLSARLLPHLPCTPKRITLSPGAPRTTTPPTTDSSRTRSHAGTGPRCPMGHRPTVQHDSGLLSLTRSFHHPKPTRPLH
jgi:hypothetical protein